MALQDIGPGDGATVLIPASHKSLVGHPFQQQMQTEGSEVEGAVEMHLKAGQVLFFQDSILHGAAARTNPGRRTTLCFRYHPRQTSNFRHDHTPSDALLGRLSPAERQLLTPASETKGDNWGVGAESGKFVRERFATGSRL